MAANLLSAAIRILRQDVQDRLGVFIGSGPPSNFLENGFGPVPYIDAASGKMYMVANGAYTEVTPLLFTQLTNSNLPVTLPDNIGATFATKQPLTDNSLKVATTSFVKSFIGPRNPISGTGYIKIPIAWDGDGNPIEFFMAQWGQTPATSGAATYMVTVNGVFNPAFSVSPGFAVIPNATSTNAHRGVICHATSLTNNGYVLTLVCSDEASIIDNGIVMFYVAMGTVTP